MPAVVIYAPGLHPSAIRSTVLGSETLDRHVAASVEETLTAAGRVQPDLVLLDKDLPHAVEIVESLRSRPETRRSSIVARARGGVDAQEVRLLGSGVNAVLRYPAGPEWDEGLGRLMGIPHRRALKAPIEISIGAAPGETSAAGEGTTVNVGLRGVLVEFDGTLPLNRPLWVRFRLPSERIVQAGGRVVRRDSAGRYGIRFDELDSDAVQAIRGFTG